LRWRLRASAWDRLATLPSIIATGEPMPIRVQNCLPTQTSVCALSLFASVCLVPANKGVFAQDEAPAAAAPLEQQDIDRADSVPPIEVVVEPPEAETGTDTSIEPVATQRPIQHPRPRPRTTTVAALPPLDTAQTGLAGPAAGDGEAFGNATDRASGLRPGLNLEAPTQLGSRLGLSPLETPASVEIIPGETIRQRGQTTVNEAVTQDAAGFTSTAAPGNGDTAFAVRGFAGHGSVMQLYDGTRLYVGSGTVTFPFDTWSAERIEVLRGPASVLYGEGAIGGVINVVPKKPTDFFTNEAEVAFGTYETGRFGVGSGGPLSDTVGYRVDISGNTSDGWLDHESDFDSIALSGVLAFKPIENLRLLISHDHADRSPLRYWGTPLIDGQILESLRDTNFNVRDSAVNYIDNWTQFRTEWEATDWLELRNIAYRLTTNRHWRNVETYIFQDAGPNAGLVQRRSYIEIYHDQEQLGNRFDARFRSELGGSAENELLLGFDVNHIDFLHTNNSPYAGESFVDPFDVVPGLFINVDPTIPKWQSETSQHALFAENRLAFSEQLSVIGGLRLDEVSLTRRDKVAGDQFTKDFSNVTWRAGTVYSPIPDLSLYAQYATGVDPVGSSLISTNLTRSQFKLATARQVEIGAKRVFAGGRGEWTVAAYDIVKNDLLTRDPDNPQTFRQVGQQSSRGIELTFAMQVTDTLRYDGNLAVLEARYDDFGTAVNGAFVDFSGNRPRNVPEQVINNWVTWNFLPRWEGYVGVQWIGSIYNDDANQVKRPPSTVVNLGLIYDVTERGELAFRVFNAFDEKYATGGGTFEWQLAPPRTAQLSYRVKY